MRTALLVLTNGRDDYLQRTLESAFEAIAGDLTPRVMVDDSQNHAYAEVLDGQWSGQFDVIDHSTRSLGFCGAIQRGWDLLAQLHEETPIDYVFHLEEDFVFTRDIKLHDMIQVLEENPHLAQVALRRQPWNENERAAGGVVEQYPDSYVDCSDEHGNEWLEHRLFFTTNPSVYRRSLIERGWPQVEHSEGIFTHQLIADQALRFAFFGPRSWAPAVFHIGDKRTGTKY